jgi:hypothetical protein
VTVVIEEIYKTIADYLSNRKAENIIRHSRENGNPEFPLKNLWIPGQAWNDG